MSPGPKLKTVRDLPAGWRGRIIKLSRQGLTEREIRERLNVSINLWYGLLKREPKFREAVETSRRLRLSRRLGVAI